MSDERIAGGIPGIASQIGWKLSSGFDEKIPGGSAKLRCLNVVY
jgi:hypothetical protein